ncbi:hypothetical protein BHE74_00028018 [Ensete ventricosum]|nr:hypothetical protein GW17_00012204 [Ensete ventricosum]RWW64727.1 hypothetical protein BHE74_00028018 [Ensete ventricosum]
MAAWAAGADESSDISGMRQRGWQMTLPTEKGVALMVVAIDASCCDWGDGKMVRLLMEEKVAGCSNRGEGVSIQRWERGSNDAGEISVDLVLDLVQHDDSEFRRGRGALDVFHDEEAEEGCWSSRQQVLRLAAAGGFDSKIRRSRGGRGALGRGGCNGSREGATAACSEGLCWWLKD